MSEDANYVSACRVMRSVRTVLLYTSPARGNLYPIVETAIALRRRGARVNVWTLAAERRALEAAGLATGAIDSRIEALFMSDWQGHSQIGRARRALAILAARSAAEVRDFSKALDVVRPDLLLVDTNCWGAQAVAESTGLPWATWHPYPLPVPSKDVPPFGLGLPRASGFFGRVRDRMASAVAERVQASALRELNTVRQAVGVRPLGRLVDVFVRAPLILLLSAEPFEYPRRDWPDNLVQVGPGLWLPPANPLSRLDSVKKPVILATCSTEYQDDIRIISTAIEAWVDDHRVQLVCTTGGVDPCSVGAPENVIVERFVPHAQVLEKACVVVAHGGMGITQRALASGVPVCIVPWARDQLEVGRRVVECGAGVVLPRAKLRADRLRMSVTAARQCLDGVRRVQTAFNAAGGAERSADLLIELASI